MATELEARQIRAARNQSLYREVNERVRSLNVGWAVQPGQVDFVCECADTACARPLTVDFDEYARIRADPASFVVAPGHVYPEVEVVTEEHDEYTVVRKIGAGEEVAASSHRSDSG